MSTSDLDSRNIALSMRKSVENLVISSQDAIGQSISQALSFSGNITNQVLQENRSVSRSPSPSLRVPDQGDPVEHEKSDSIPSSGDGGSVCDIHVPNLRTGDKNSTPPKLSERNKKKSWYSSLYPTYKSRCDDFRRLFRDVPDDERLIVDYSCALQKDILAHGRLYASQRYLCFYANIFGWETSLSLRWKDVTAITKEKTALVIPNAILVCAANEKHFLTSFSGRDKAYLMLFRVWQNALMDQPMSSHEIWQWVHSCYGAELGFNSDDEGYNRDDDDKPTPGMPDELLETSSLEAGGERDDPRPDPHHDPRLDPPVSNGALESGAEEAADGLPTDMSDSSDSDRGKVHSGELAPTCSCAHDGKVILRQQFTVNIDQVFTALFTSSRMYLELLCERSARDYVQLEPWKHDAATGQKLRQISYTLALSSGPIGPKEVYVTETQVMNACSEPGALYSIDSVSANAGIPYADHFDVRTHYCLRRLAGRATLLELYFVINYKKTLWPMFKGFLEKNALAGVEQYARLVAARLAAEAAAPDKRKGRRRRRAPGLLYAASASEPCPLPLAPPAAAAPRAATRWLLGIVLLLLAINALLYWRLSREPRPFSLDELQTRVSSLQSPAAAGWRAQLERHARRQRAELAAWRDALARAARRLHETEQALSKLLESIRPSLDAAQALAARDRADL